ncbi:MAG: peptidase M61, partial [Candidatus Eremiobacteraeota bacterium]|nr:peptidase M61 [Candidatus Eremiobacteraeota bacterium]
MIRLPFLLGSALFALLSTLGSGSALAQSETANEKSTAASYATPENPMTVVLDARQAYRGLMFAHITLPAKPGPFTLVYPKWIPGEHGPTGPLRGISVLRISTSGHALEWRRDDVDMYAFHVDVPAGSNSLTVDYNVLVNSEDDVMATKNVAIINWNRDLLYQAGTASDHVFVKPSIVLPAGWGYGTALTGAQQNGDRVDFAQTTLETLIDSPLDMGRYYKHIIQWESGDASAQVDIFADRPQALEIPPKLLTAYKNYVPETLALFGGRHWQHYHALLTLSDEIGSQGIEHHQSSDDRETDDFFTDPTSQLSSGDLLTHEFTHSWNGKYRRPA